MMHVVKSIPITEHASMMTHSCHFVCSFTERMIEDHELVLNMYHSWPRDSGNRFVFREDPLKYDLFEHPIKYFPAHLGMSADEIQTGSAKAERAKAILLKEFFTSSGRVPELEGNLFYKEQGEKKTWKKAYFMLRSSGIYYSTKGKTRVRCGRT
jgi:hypothetical protein